MIVSHHTRQDSTLVLAHTIYREYTTLLHTVSFLETLRKLMYVLRCVCVCMLLQRWEIQLHQFKKKYSYFNDILDSSKWSTAKLYEVQLSYMWPSIGTGNSLWIGADTCPHILTFHIYLSLSKSPLFLFYLLSVSSSLSPPSFPVNSSCLNYMVGFLQIYSVSLLFPWI